MKNDLTPAAEDFIAYAVANGAYPSRVAVLEAAIAALREKSGNVDRIETPSFSTVELSPEECARLQAEALAKLPESGKSSGYSISE